MSEVKVLNDDPAAQIGKRGGIIRCRPIEARTFAAPTHGFGTSLCGLLWSVGTWLSTLHAPDNWC